MQLILDTSNGRKLINAQNIDGRTPLALVAWWGTLPLAQVILVNGVDIEIPTHNGWTPLLMSL